MAMTAIKLKKEKIKIETKINTKGLVRIADNNTNSIRKFFQNTDIFNEAEYLLDEAGFINNKDF